MFGKSDASTSTTDDVKVRPLWVYYFPQALGVLSAEPPSALPAGGDMWATPARARRPGALVRPVASPATTLLTDEPWLSSSSSEPRRLLPYARFLPPLRLPTPRSFSPDSDDIWTLPARPTKLSLPPIDIPQIETIERDDDSPCSPSVTTVTAWSSRGSMRSRVRRQTRGVRKRRTRLADMQRVVASLPRRTLHGGAIPSRCSAALRAALRELRAAWIPITTPHTYIVSRTWSLSEQEIPCEQESNRSSSGASVMSRRAMWAELGARPGASPGLLRRRYSAPETIMRKYRLEQQRDACCSSVTSCRSPASSPGHAPRAPLARRALLRAALHCSPPPPHAPMLDALEVIVTETVRPITSSDDNYPPPSLPVDIDEYVSSVLVESLNSLTDRIESAIGSESRLSIVEKEIKVRLQHTGVNTIVHLSPTSNNQIIFGNEELCNREDDRDECNNVVKPPLPSEEVADDANNNPPAAVLRQLQRLFHGGGSRDASPDVSRIEISNVDAYLDSSGESPATISVVAGPRAGPRSGPTSPPASLVDSLEDPASPRCAPPPRSPRAAPEAFFVGIRDDAPPSSCSVAAVLPARIRQRLQRRQRRRQQRAESRRRPAARDAAALLDALLDEIISITTKDEYKKIKSEQKRKPPARVSKRETPTAARDPLELRLDAEKRARRLRGRLSLQPHPPITSTNSRRLYQKSEIMEGSKRVEILEILEYVDSSSSSPETSVTEESASQRRRSRIPVPVSGTRRDLHEEDAERLRRLLRDALEPGAAPGPRSSSLRFQRVFEAIPEELCRSAGTSPPPRAVLSRATMTSPARRHAATSPRRPPPATSPRRPQPATSPPPPPPPRHSPLEEKRSKTPEQQSKVPVPMKPVERSKASKLEAPAGAEDSSSSCEERGLLCALPRRRRAPRRRPAPAPAPPPKPPPKPLPPEPSLPSPGPKRELEIANIKPQPSTEPATTRTETGAAVVGTATGTGWSVTIAGERVPPHELQLRLRFPPAPAAQPSCQDSTAHALPQATSTPDTSRTSLACACRHCRVGGSRALPPAHPAHPPHAPTRGSSRACDAGRLPSLRRDSLVSQVKTRRACSPRCWLPAAPAHLDHHHASCLQVVGAAVVPLPRAAPRRHR